MPTTAPFAGWGSAPADTQTSAVPTNTPFVCEITTAISCGTWNKIPVVSQVITFVSGDCWAFHWSRFTMFLTPTASPRGRSGSWEIEAGRDSWIQSLQWFLTVGFGCGLNGAAKRSSRKSFRKASPPQTGGSCNAKAPFWRRNRPHGSIYFKILNVLFLLLPFLKQQLLQLSCCVQKSQHLFHNNRCIIEHYETVSPGGQGLLSGCQETQILVKRQMICEFETAWFCLSLC